MKLFLEWYKPNCFTEHQTVVMICKVNFLSFILHEITKLAMEQGHKN